MSTQTAEFYELLESISNEQTFNLEFAPRSQDSVTAKCKQLTTAQLKTLIQTVVDSPITQSAFNSAATKTFKSCLVEPVSITLNVIDRLLFILEARIHSISSTGTLKDETKKIDVDYEQIKNQILESFKQNPQLIEPQTVTEGKITVNFGVASLDTEEKLNNEIYKNLNPKIENVEELRKLIGEAFIHEIAKSINYVSIGEKTLNFTNLDFKSRVKTVETLPASLIQNIISYIENYKKIIDDSFTIDGTTLTVDGTLFTSR